MPTKNVTDERLSKFKNKGKDPAKLREKRITECVELRKAHKNENFLKRRNITLSSLPDEETLSPDYIPNELVNVNSECRTSQTRGCQAARENWYCSSTGGAHESQGAQCHGGVYGINSVTQI
uniref:Karyopherin alpha 7 (importin alpha 8) n=1 Tax=Amphilophus citrinellus TaxID=61819 RepID=A0A3Q0SH36_AMPCI